MRPVRLLYRPEESAEALGISRAMLYQKLASGEIRSVKIGRSRRISREELERYVASLQGSTPASGDAA